MIESKEHLAGYLAVHHHKNNLAMLFTNPDKKVRLLLSYFLYAAQQEITRIINANFYRAIITECDLGYQEVVRRYEAGELSDDNTLRLTDLLVRKAELAHDKLMEVANASA